MLLHPVSDYLDLAHLPCAEIFSADEEVWTAIPRIAEFCRAIRASHEGDWVGNARETVWIGPNVHIGRGTVIMPGACIQGPAWIGERCRISPGCWIRENVVVGNDAILGNSCELKNCVISDRAEVPHWNYVGDSLLGYKAHLGAGVILSNWRHDHGAIPVLDERAAGGRIETGLPKFGAVVGDFADIGSNAVLNPGAMIGRRSILYPGSVWRGTLPSDRIVKTRPNFDVVERRA
jgi:UDP-N-acetylglucosamine diphosphorylase / glucose-1-phosphate thymidylyltransferase / UDP-N-acetylgalactosamine diphosphorylase / glucosamine-1-phosphate N-acetyltransferase / galactosamine-1-phosphate N-acetyltransferase